MLLGISAGTTILDVAIDGRAPVKALIREIQRDSAPARPRSSTSTSTRSGPTRRSPLEVPVHLVGIPDGVRNFGGVLDHVAPRARDRGAAERHPGARRARRHRAHHRPLALRARRARRRRPRSSTIPTRRSAPSWRRAPKRRRPSSRKSPTTEPELIRKPKAEDEDETEARRPEPCAPSWGWATPARSTTKPGTMPGFDWPTTSPRAGGLRPFRARRAGARRPRAPWTATAVRLLKPQTYMNRSGAALAPLRALPGFDPASDLLVLVDDVALPVGRFRLRGAGSAGGHNGLKSIEGALQRQDYARLRIGVGPRARRARRPRRLRARRRSSREERRAVDELLDPMAEAVECWLDEDRAGHEPVQPVSTAASPTRDSYRHASTRHRRPAQRRQVHPLQRPHLRQGAGGELSVRHHRAEHRHRAGARPAARRAGADRAARSAPCPPWSSSWTSRDWSRARARAKDWATSSSPTSARWTRSCTWSAASRTTTSSTSWARSTRCATARSSTSSSASPTWPASRSGSTRRPAPPSRATRRPSSSSALLEARARGAGRRAARRAPWSRPRRRRADLPELQPAHRQAGALRRQRGRGRDRRAATRTSTRSGRRSTADGETAEVVTFSAKVEAELAELPPRIGPSSSSRSGSRESGLDRLAHAAYHLLGLQSYFTAGEKEVRAWTIHRGDRAPAAAGVIHSDFEKGFIRAETVAYDDFVRVGGWKAAREQGLARAEGKEYVVRDGDVMLFRFSSLAEPVRADPAGGTSAAERAPASRCLPRLQMADGGEHARSLPRARSATPDAGLARSIAVTPSAIGPPPAPTSPSSSTGGTIRCVPILAAPCAISVADLVPAASSVAQGSPRMRATAADASCPPMQDTSAATSSASSSSQIPSTADSPQSTRSQSPRRHFRRQRRIDAPLA